MDCVRCGNVLTKRQKLFCSRECSLKTWTEKGKKSRFNPERLKKLWQDPKYKKEVSKKISISNKGKVFSNEHIQNLSKAHKGILQPKGTKSSHWKGNKASYSAIHGWVIRHWGRATKCEHCGKKNMKQYDWSNKDHKYKRVKKDWQQLCRGCHIRYDHKLEEAT